MSYEDVTFDSFMDLPSSKRKLILNDPVLLSGLVRKVLKPSRYEHSLRVAKLAEKLALAHHVDPRRACIAGLLHDCTKYLNNEQHDAYLRYYDPDKLNYPESCKHAFSAKYYLREKLNFHDSGILNAIYNHTICFSKDRLSLILYIADKREPGRQIEDDIVAIAMNDLNKAMLRLSWDVEKYLKDVKNERFIKNGL